MVQSRRITDDAKPVLYALNVHCNKIKSSMLIMIELYFEFKIVSTSFFKIGMFFLQIIQIAASSIRS